VNRPPIALLSVVVLLGAAVATDAARGERPVAASATPSGRDTRPVDGALAVCPELVKSGTDVVTRLTAGVAIPGDVTVRAAKLEPGVGLGSVVLDTGARVGALPLKSDANVAAVVTASGPQAGGLEVEQVSRGADGVRRGWAGTRCEAPVADSWFLGAGTQLGSDSQLVLVNPYDDPALVRVELHGQNGPIDIPELDGIVIPARGRVPRDLAALAPDEPLLAVRVVAREGRVAPALRVQRQKGTTPLGVDWLPRLTAPGETVDIPGIPGGNGTRRLYAFAPGEDPVHLRLQFTLPGEQIVPVGFEDLEVPAGKPVLFDLTRPLQLVDQRTGEKTQQPVSLRIFAEGGPVFTTAFAENRAKFLPIQEIAYVGPATALTGPTMVTEARNLPGMQCALIFSAPDGLGRLRVETVLKHGHNGETQRVIVTVPQGRLVVVPYTKFPPDPLQSLVITPAEDMAPVYVTRVIYEQGQRGPLFTAQALTTQPTAGYDVPFVGVDPGAALPDAPEAP
jgi:hypothetical protein